MPITAENGAQALSLCHTAKLLHLFLGRRGDVAHGVFPSKANVLIVAQTVVRQEVDLLNSRKGRGKACDAADLLGRIVEGGNGGHANDQVAPALGDPFGIVQDQLVAHGGKALVLFGVGMLDVHQHRVQIRKMRSDHALKGEAGRGLHRRIDAVRLGLLEEGVGKFGLAKRLSARQSHSSAASAVIGHILHHLLHDLAHRSIVADHFILFFGFELLNAVALGLGIAAPAASQDTPLEKDHRANARSVVCGKFLDIKDPSHNAIVFHKASTFLLAEPA